jgi:hypothetical protein
LDTAKIVQEPGMEGSRRATGDRTITRNAKPTIEIPITDARPLVI